mmetsp:Transcript_2560/g.4349  ORF Transcript_2560/g.4349 Transcript_2560/m.4349 type:complete len:312 (-) Transcript_2560:57-992(-)|eukprot:CAMPEP_0119323970 /NCGR_PEP_ID=MMETSP1333-20130426/62065_1 /TAXON_ID=418940 /ORGANISM="Scyphosphaera apsteinii, Strain RCC1455" /LENGTH=311 /DNA_ID=CAMNT_0007331557 /DNA_START=18 /DNA_END=953 /DNA_ORIENTATION=+
MNESFDKAVKLALDGMAAPIAWETAGRPGKNKESALHNIRARVKAARLKAVQAVHKSAKPVSWVNETSMRTLDERKGFETVPCHLENKPTASVELTMFTITAILAIAVFSGACIFYRMRRRAITTSTCATIYYLSGAQEGASNAIDATVDARENCSNCVMLREAILAADPNAAIVASAEIVSRQTASRRFQPPGTEEDTYWQQGTTLGHAFDECVSCAAQADVVVCYMPCSRMDSAIELYAARTAGRITLVIAPGKMRGNCVVRQLADQVFESVEELSNWLHARVKQARSGDSTVCMQVRNCVPPPMENIT